MRALFCQTKPTVSRLYFTSSRSVIVNKFLPPTIKEPALGRSKPPIMFKKVDLPLPLLPIRAVSSPSSTTRSRPCKARTSVSLVL